MFVYIHNLKMNLKRKPFQWIILSHDNGRMDNYEIFQKGMMI
jgi:hypothetical protein